MQKSVVKRKKKVAPVSCGIGVGGMFRVKIVNPDGTCVGDSGWKKNVITNTGLHYGIMGRLVGMTGSVQPNYFALGRLQSSVATNASSLVTECAGTQMIAVTTATSGRGAYNSSGTLQFTATFSSNLFAASTTVAAAGLHHTNSGGSSTSLLCGATFASSTVATNQAINCTYQLLFAATVTDN